MTLVGAGVKHVADYSQLTAKVLPKKCEWIRDTAAGFNPDKLQSRCLLVEEVQIDSRCLVILVMMYYLQRGWGILYSD